MTDIPRSAADAYRTLATHLIMIDNLHMLMLDPDSYEVAWDYCLERDIIITQFVPIDSPSVLPNTRMSSSNGSWYSRTVYYDDHNSRCGLDYEPWHHGLITRSCTTRSDSL